MTALAAAVRVMRKKNYSKPLESFVAVMPFQGAQYMVLILIEKAKLVRRG